MENKKLELSDEKLEKVTGGTEDDWYWGFGSPPDYPNACPRCGGSGEVITVSRHRVAIPDFTGEGKTERREKDER